MNVKVISLMQPWAQLVVMGVKQIETRGRNYSYTGPVLIHASKGKHMGRGDNKISCRELCYKNPFKKYIPGGAAYDKLPFGAIIGSVNIIQSMPTSWYMRLSQEKHRKDWSSKIKWNEELEFGNYEANRYGILLQNPVQYAIAVAAKGQVCFPWNFDMPDHFAIANDHWANNPLQLNK